MKIKYVFLVSSILLITGYIVGQFIPWDLLHPSILNKEISINDYYTRLISIIGAVATIFATFVALFKEDIRKIYENASLKVDFKDSNIISEVLNIESTTSSSQNIAAKKYEIIISIHNCGKLAAKGCQVYLEQIKFKHSSFPVPKDLPISGKPLSWIGKSESAVIIPSTAKGYLTLLEILSPQSEIIAQDQSLSSNNSSAALLQISGTDLILEDYGGKYDCIFMIYSENSAPVEFKLEINWNGNWHQRFTEMKDSISIKHSSSKK